MRMCVWEINGRRKEMAKIQKKDGSLVIKKSFWSAISIWWTLVFLVAIPVFGVLVYLDGPNGLLKLNLSEKQDELFKMVGLGVAAASFALTFIVLFIKLICVKKTSWTFYDGAVVYKEGRIFYTEEKTRDMEFFPGMSVSVRRTVKGKFCSYGDVVISNGAGEAGEIVMIGVKRPRKVQKLLRQLITMACTRTANMMSPYKMYPQMYRHVLGGYPAYYYGALQGQQQSKK